MRLNIFFYVIANLLLVQLTSLELVNVNLVINIICVLGIGTLGIAHGAIDDVLYGVKERKSKFVFIGKYLAGMALIGLLWLLASDVAILIFLFVSAFHFGQTQLVEYKIKSKLLKNTLCFSWGSFIILAMLSLNQEALSGLSYTTFDLPYSYSFILDNSSILLICFSSLLTALFVVLGIKKTISVSSILKELYLLALVLCSFYVLEPFVAFALFFVLIHSLKAVNQEFEFCKHRVTKNMNQFLVLFLPLTACSIVAVMLFLFGLLYFNHGEIIPYALLILISCITIPHSFVMDKFYNLLK